jgi:selenoprotein W-related protein
MPEETRNRLVQAYGQFREEHRTLSDREVVHDLRVMIEHGVTQKAGSIPLVASQAAPAVNAATPATNGQVKVSITYCAECGYEPQTLALTSALMHEFVHGLASIEIIPWQDGAFDVVVNGDLVHSMYRDGGFPEDATIIQAVRDRLA